MKEVNKKKLKALKLVKKEMKKIKGGAKHGFDKISGGG